jgi:hypothetical protein
MASDEVGWEELAGTSGCVGWMMEESRTHRLQELLRRLGKAVHGSVVHSDEVRACLDELHDEGWHAVVLLETSLACCESGSVEVDKGVLRMHVGTADSAIPEYRLDVADARFLSSLGISAGRHRSPNNAVGRPRAERDSESAT